MRATTGLLIAALLIGCGADLPGTSDGGGTPFGRPELDAAELITADAIRPVIAEISSDRYAGRGPGTEGDRAARAYLAAGLADAGFEPAGDAGGWEQTFELVGIAATPPASWGFSREDATLELASGSEFMAFSGVQAQRAGIADAEIVFVGYGIEAPEYDWDDFKDTDLSGKVLLMLNNDPDRDPALFEGETRLYYGRWSYKYESAARQGAAGAIIIHTTPSAGYPWQVVQNSWSGQQFELPAGAEPRVQLKAWVTEEAARRLVDLAGLDLAALTAAAHERDFRPVPLGVRTSLTLENTLSRTTTANVLGRLPGSDAALADEAVIYMAHHDHLGLAPVGAGSGQGDRIYNGARDNGSGVGMVSAIAEAFEALPTAPRRSILVAYVGAEEQGLLGSKFLATNPVVPTARMAAVVNFDAANIWGRTRDISFIGFGKSTLDEVAEAVAAFQGRTVVGDQFPDRGYFYRSDQFSLAQVGVPGMYVKGGNDFIGRPEGWGEEQLVAYERDRYHAPSDELTGDWNFEGLVEDARFGFLAGLMIANDDSLPAWRAGDEFEGARLEALQAAP
jgi:Zn-dependent M28 family amino/carboxypeptidase